MRQVDHVLVNDIEANPFSSCFPVSTIVCLCKLIDCKLIKRDSFCIDLFPFSNLELHTSTSAQLLIWTEMIVNIDGA